MSSKKHRKKLKNKHKNNALICQRYNEFSNPELGVYYLPDLFKHSKKIIVDFSKIKSTY